MLVWLAGQGFGKSQPTLLTPDRETLGATKVMVDSPGFGDCSRRVKRALAWQTTLVKKQSSSSGGGVQFSTKRLNNLSSSNLWARGRPARFSCYAAGCNYAGQNLQRRGFWLKERPFFGEVFMLCNGNGQFSQSLLRRGFWLKERPSFGKVYLLCERSRAGKSMLVSVKVVDFETTVCFFRLCGKLKT